MDDNINRRFLEGLGSFIDKRRVLPMAEKKFFQSSYITNEVRNNILLQLGIPTTTDININLRDWNKIDEFRKLIYLIYERFFDEYYEQASLTDSLPEEALNYLDNVAWVLELDSDEKFENAKNIVLDEGYDEFNIYKDIFDLTDDEVSLLKDIEMFKSVFNRTFFEKSKDELVEDLNKIKSGEIK